MCGTVIKARGGHILLYNIKLYHEIKSQEKKKKNISLNLEVSFLLLFFFNHFK